MTEAFTIGYRDTMILLDLGLSIQMIDTMHHEAVRGFYGLEKIEYTKGFNAAMLEKKSDLPMPAFLERLQERIKK